MSPLAIAIFTYLADGGIHGGAKLAQHFGVTRQGIWKAINELKAHDLVASVGRRGYQAKFSYGLLDEANILRHLPVDLRAKINALVIHRITESTNNDAATWPIEHGVIVLSEMQTQGRGRNARPWLSPLAASLYFSMKICFRHQAVSKLTSFSPTLGVYVAQMLQQQGIPVVVKWPNDLWVAGAKLGGILIEIQSRAENYAQMTIGIGLNNHKVARGSLDQAATDCETLLGYALDRNILAAKLIEIIFLLHGHYEANELPDISMLWKKYSALYGKRVRLFSPFKEVIGIECGIAENGALMIEEDTGTINNYFSGELSLRPYA